MESRNRRAISWVRRVDVLIPDVSMHSTMKPIVVTQKIYVYLLFSDIFCNDSVMFKFALFGYRTLIDLFSFFVSSFTISRLKSKQKHFRRLSITNWIFSHPTAVFGMIICLVCIMQLPQVENSFLWRFYNGVWWTRPTLFSFGAITMSQRHESLCWTMIKWKYRTVMSCIFACPYYSTNRISSHQNSNEYQYAFLCMVCACHSCIGIMKMTVFSPRILKLPSGCLRQFK